MTLSLSIAGPDSDHGALAALAQGAAPADYALLAGEQPVTAYSQPRRILYRTLIASLVFHVALLTFSLLRPAASTHQLGVEEGLPENLNVSVITAEDLKRMSSDPFHQEASLPSQPASQESEPTPEEKQEEAPPPTQSDATQKPDDPSGFIAKATEEFSASITQAFNDEAARRKKAQASAKAAANLKSFRPGATHVGKSDEFERAVIWALSATKPQGNGNWGITAVTFIVAATGQVEDLRLLRSSGDSWLDTAALMSVRQARLPVPPSGLLPETELSTWSIFLVNGRNLTSGIFAKQESGRSIEFLQLTGKRHKTTNRMSQIGAIGRLHRAAAT